MTKYEKYIYVGVFIVLFFIVLFLSNTSSLVYYNYNKLVGENNTITAHANLYFHNDSNPLIVGIPNPDIYYNITGLTEFNTENMQTDNDSIITVLYDGQYFIQVSSSFQGGANNEYEMELFINEVEVMKGCEFHRKLGTGGDVGSASLTCNLDLVTGDELRIKMEDETNPTSDAEMLNIIFHVHKIGGFQNTTDSLLNYLRNDGDNATGNYIFNNTVLDIRGNIIIGESNGLTTGSPATIYQDTDVDGFSLRGYDDNNATGLDCYVIGVGWTYCDADTRWYLRVDGNNVMMLATASTTFYNTPIFSTIVNFPQGIVIYDDKDIQFGQSGIKWYMGHLESGDKFRIRDSGGNEVMSFVDAGSTSNVSFNNGQVFIENTGNVGIGDLSPDATLEVIDDFMVSSTISGDGDKFIVETSTGDVGININNPSAKLSVKGNDVTGSVVAYFEGSNTGVDNMRYYANRPVFEIRSTEGTPQAVYQQVRAGSVNQFKIVDVAQSVDVFNMDLKSSVNRNIYYHNFNHFGFNTVNPNATLHVGGDVIIDDLKGTYTGGNASVCVYDNGTLYASDGGC